MINKVPVWVKLWDLSKELWGHDDQGLNFAASPVGDPKMMEEATKNKKYTDYARVCVIISAKQDLQTIFTVDVGRLSQFKVEYKWVPSCCKVCKVFGHATFVCFPKTTANQHEQPHSSSNAQPPTGPAKEVPGPLALLDPAQSSGAFVFGGRIDFEHNSTSRMEDSFSSHDSYLAANTCQAVALPPTTSLLVVQLLNGDGSSIVLLEDLATPHFISPNKFIVLELEEEFPDDSIPFDGEEHLFIDTLGKVRGIKT